MANTNLLRSAGLAAALLGLVAFTPSAFAQYQEPGTYWNGATPTAPGPANGPEPMYGPTPMFGPAPAAQYSYAPNYGGWAPTAAGNDAPGVAGPYWHGAPEAIGPGS
jgi:hypothetical protein